MSLIAEPVEESHRGVGRLAPPQRHDVVGVERNLRLERGAHLDDPLPLHLQHRADVDSTQVGKDQLQQQFATEVARVCHRCRQPLAQLCSSGSSGGEDRAVAAGDARLLANCGDVTANL